MFLLQLQLLSVIAPIKSSSEFRWTDDELELLLKCCGVDSGKKSGGGCVVITFYSLCQCLWGSSPAVNSIPNSIKSQNDSSEALESVASHFSSTVTDEIGLFDDHQKSQENADSSDDAADDEEVNSNPVGQSQQYPGREKVKTFLKNRRSQKLSTRMGTEPQILQFAKEDLNLKRKLLKN